MYYQEPGTKLDGVEGRVPILAHDERAWSDVIFSALKTDLRTYLMRLSIKVSFK